MKKHLVSAVTGALLMGVGVAAQADDLLGETNATGVLKICLTDAWDNPYCDGIGVNYDTASGLVYGKAIGCLDYPTMGTIEQTPQGAWGPGKREISLQYRNDDYPYYDRLNMVIRANRTWASFIIDDWGNLVLFNSGKWYPAPCVTTAASAPASNAAE
jgi:hypothetical protein